MPTLLTDWQQAIDRRSLTVGVIGLGYVGLPLADALHASGLRVVGFDIDAGKIDKLAKAQPYLTHLGQGLFDRLAGSDRFEATTDMGRLGEADVVMICLPTPIDVRRTPDLSYVLRAGEQIGRTLRAGQLVVLESTTYPGTTRNELRDAIEGSSGGSLKLGQDWFLAYSPEREDPGSRTHTTKAIPKLVGGVDDASREMAAGVYRAAFDQVVEVSSVEVAEAAKIFENVFRAVNIALVNELKVILGAMGIDVWEVIAAASTKPFGFMPFFPGPGLGGHCIPVDPYYLAWKAHEVGEPTRFIELAGEINRAMPERVVMKLGEALNEREKALRGAKVLVLGVAYKPNVDDIRESPAAEIIELLQHQGAEVSYHDPHMPVFPSMRRYAIDLRSVGLTEGALRASDAVLIVTDHDAIDWELVTASGPVIIDTRNAVRRRGLGDAAGDRLVHA